MQKNEIKFDQLTKAEKEAVNLDLACSAQNFIEAMGPEAPLKYWRSTSNLLLGYMARYHDRNGDSHGEPFQAPDYLSEQDFLVLGDVGVLIDNMYAALNNKEHVNVGE